MSKQQKHLHFTINRKMQRFKNHEKGLFDSLVTLHNNQLTKEHYDKFN